LQLKVQKFKLNYILLFAGLKVKGYSIWPLDFYAFVVLPKSLKKRNAG